MGRACGFPHKNKKITPNGVALAVWLCEFNLPCLGDVLWYSVKSKGIVWSLTEEQLPNWGTPRDCPRVCYRAVKESTQNDIDRFYSSSSRHCVAIEHDWHQRMLDTALYIYEFSTANFYFDERAGFYVSDKTETPIAITKHENLYEELFKRNVEVRILDNLWQLGEEVQKSSLKWSLCRMHNAKPKRAVQ